MTNREFVIALINHENFRRRLVIIFAALSVLSSGLYFYFIGHSVYTVAERRDVEARITALGGEVASLEADYMTKLSMINLETAASLGFVDSSQRTIYAAFAGRNLSESPSKNPNAI